MKINIDRIDRGRNERLESIPAISADEALTQYIQSQSRLERIAGTTVGFQLILAVANKKDKESTKRYLDESSINLLSYLTSDFYIERKEIAHVSLAVNADPDEKASDILDSMAHCIEEAALSGKRVVLSVDNLPAWIQSHSAEELEGLRPNAANLLPAVVIFWLTEETLTQLATQAKFLWDLRAACLEFSAVTEEINSPTDGKVRLFAKDAKGNVFKGSLISAATSSLTLKSQRQGNPVIEYWVEPDSDGPT